LLAKTARAQLQSIRATKPHQYTEALLDYIPRVTPRWVSPIWLAPYIEILTQAIGKPIRAVVAAPPQHGKTESTIHAFPWWLRKSPGRRHAYATYGQERSERVSEKARLVAERDGQTLKFRQDYWHDELTGSAILWTSVGGPFTGEPVDGVLVIDDPTKDRKQADSGAFRQHQIDWFDDVAEPRCHPGASIIVMATRWHPEDLSGVLIKRGWPYLNLKALSDGPLDESGRVKDDPLHRFPGEPLCEARKPREDLLEKKRVNAYTFASLYQGEPRPRGGSVFGEPSYYSELPEKAFKVGYGVDLAYSKSTHADWSVCIELWMENRDGKGADGKPLEPLFYVRGVRRAQVQAPEFLLTIHALQSQRRGPMRWYAAGSERGAGDFIQRKVKALEIQPASGDKFARAQPVSEAWNAGRVLVPSDEPEWLPSFLDEIQNFTGVNDVHDDQVDALAAGYDVLLSAPKYSYGMAQ
jgi:predicted phage terminase large subunit-like protein